jgi:hypothetical protein
MSIIQVPDLVTTNINPLYFQITQPDTKYRTIEEVEQERNYMGDAKFRKDQKLTDKSSYETPYKNVLTGIQELGPFSKAFFSRQNLDLIQENIRYIVYTKSKNVISTQDETNLVVMMREIYLQNSRNPSSSIELMRAEIKRLNELTYAKVVPSILSEILQYKTYLSDIDKVRTPIQLPINTTNVGLKTNRGFSDVLGLDVYS